MFTLDNFAFKGDLGNANTPNVATYNVPSGDIVSIAEYFNDLSDSLQAGDLIHCVDMSQPAGFKLETRLVSSVIAGVVTTEEVGL